MAIFSEEALKVLKDFFWHWDYKIIEDPGFQKALEIILGPVQTNISKNTFEAILLSYSFSQKKSGVQSYTIPRPEKGLPCSIIEFSPSNGMIKLYNTTKWKKKFSAAEIKQRPYIITISINREKDNRAQISIDNKVIAELPDGQHIVCDIPERYWIDKNGKVQFEKNEKSIFLLPEEERGRKADYEDFLNTNISQRSSAIKSMGTMLKNAGWNIDKNGDLYETLVEAYDDIGAKEFTGESLSQTENLQLSAVMKTTGKYKLVSWQAELTSESPSDSHFDPYVPETLAKIKYRNKKPLLEMQGINPETGIKTYKSYTRLSKGDILYIKKEKSQTSDLGKE